MFNQHFVNKGFLITRKQRSHMKYSHKESVFLRLCVNLHYQSMRKVMNKESLMVGIASTLHFLVDALCLCCIYLMAEECIIRKTKCSEKIKRSDPVHKTKCSFWGFPPQAKNASKTFVLRRFFIIIIWLCRRNFVTLYELNWGVLTLNIKIKSYIFISVKQLVCPL